MELRQKLASSLGIHLPVTLLYDHQSIDEIVDFICREVVARDSTAAAHYTKGARRGGLMSEGSEGGEEGSDRDQDLGPTGSLAPARSAWPRHEDSSSAEPTAGPSTLLKVGFRV